MYKGNKEIKEIIWQLWDLLNDNIIINKLLLSTPLINELKKVQSQTNKESSDKESNKSKNKLDENGKYLILIIYFYYRYINICRRYSISISFKNNNI